uniref:Uncharacterized protein n=1 Tax=Oryza rufipogon TaxID=4529 RepID=A0A0E0R1I5_ORYRU
MVEAAGSGEGAPAGERWAMSSRPQATVAGDGMNDDGPSVAAVEDTDLFTGWQGGSWRIRPVAGSEAPALNLADGEYDVTSAAAAGPYDAYLVFRSSPPLNSSVVSISNLLNVTTTTVTESNAVNPVVPIAVDPLVFAPVVGDLIPTCRLA